MPRRPAGSRGAGARVLFDETRARAAALDLLARKAWSVRDLAARLRRRGAPPEVARAVVERLGAQGYLDDRAFARFWAETRARSRRVGPARLVRELRARGIAPELAAAAAAEAFAEVPEAERAREAARRRLAALRRGAPERVAPRLRDYLLRRGYAPGVVADTLRGLLGATAAPDEAGDPDPPAGAGAS